MLIMKKNPDNIVNIDVIKTDESKNYRLEHSALNEAKHNYLMTPIVYYQAKRDIINDVWNSSEALVRWKDDNGQIIPHY